MSWEMILSEWDYKFYKENISFLEESIVNHFTDSNKAPEILSAIRKVPRHLFVNQSYKYLAYTDNAFPTSCGLTTSAPSVIAEMIYNAGVKHGQKVLEVGTGTGYEAAILAEIGAQVYTIEINPSVANAANNILVRLGYKTTKSIKTDAEQKQQYSYYSELHAKFPNRGPVRLYLGNGSRGLKTHAPFNAIILAASTHSMKSIEQLTLQLNENGGRLVAPVGEKSSQQLYILERRSDRIFISFIEGISFDFVRLVLSG